VNEYEHLTEGLKSELAGATDRNKQNLQELSEKEEELVVVRVELSTLQEKFAVKKEQVCCFIYVMQAMCR